MATTLTSLRAIPLTARFADIYGGDDRIPEEVRRPSSHFQAIPREGQYATIVIAESSDGQTGYGECFGLPTPHAAAEIVNRVIAPSLLNAPLQDPSAMLGHVRKYLVALGQTRGPAMEALSGVDIALWDLAARREGRSIVAMLGAEVAPVPTYVSPVPFLATPEATGAAAVKLLNGFHAVKLKIGRGATADIPFIAAVRDAIGRDRRLMLDANCAYDLNDAMTLVDELKGLDIAWLEEPLRPDDLAGLRSLSERTDIPLAGGENEFTTHAMASLMKDARITIVQPNISRAGGISGLMEIDRLASAHGARVAPHGVGGAIVVAATLQGAAAMDAFLTFEVNRLPNPLRDELGVRPVFEDGYVLPGAGPGHGVTVQSKDIARFSGTA